jgi:glycosyltransferase involved in cell wall biosynthesis
MKITYLSAAVVPARSAHSVHVMKMCAAFARTGHDVTLLGASKNELREAGVQDVFAYYGVERQFDIELLPWYNIPGRTFLHAFAIALRARSLGGDLAFGRSLAACYIADRLGLDVAWESHAPLPENHGVMRWMLERAARSRRFRGLIVVTRALQSYYEDNVPSMRGRIIVASDGADECKVTHSTRYAVPAKLNVGYVGHLYPGRGIDLILAMARRAEWAHFHLFGGTESDISRWRVAARSLGNVTFHGFLPPAMTEEARASMDVLLAPYGEVVAVHGGAGDTSRWMSPLKLFEYMAAGKAILCSDLPVVREVLQDTYTARLLPVDDHDAWLKVLYEYSRNPAAAAQIGANARREFLTKYTWDSRAERILTGLSLTN